MLGLLQGACYDPGCLDPDAGKKFVLDKLQWACYGQGLLDLDGSGKDLCWTCCRGPVMVRTF